MWDVPACARIGRTNGLTSSDFIFGLRFGDAAWRRKPGVQLLLFAFETLGAKALFAGHHPANSASRHVLGKLGFHFTHEEFYRPTGLMHPSYLLQLADRDTGVIKNAHAD